MWAGGGGALAIDGHAAVVLDVRQLLLLVLRHVTQTLAVLGAGDVAEDFAGRRLRECDKMM